MLLAQSHADAEAEIQCRTWHDEWVLIEISDLTDPRLVDYTSLTDVALRRKLETERGLYMAESSKVIYTCSRCRTHPAIFHSPPRVGCPSWSSGSDRRAVPPTVGTYLFLWPRKTRWRKYGFHLPRSVGGDEPPRVVDPVELLATARGEKPRAAWSSWKASWITPTWGPFSVRLPLWVLTLYW